MKAAGFARSVPRRTRYFCPGKLVPLDADSLRYSTNAEDPQSAEISLHYGLQTLSREGCKEDQLIIVAESRRKTVLTPGTARQVEEPKGS